MARAAVSAQGTNSRIPVERTPAIKAIERMAKMAAAGASASKMVTAIDGILISWASEDLPAGEMRACIEQLRSDIDAGAQAGEDYVGEADTDLGRKAAQGQLEALTAVAVRLASALHA